MRVPVGCGNPGSGADRRFPSWLYVVLADQAVEDFLTLQADRVEVDGSHRSQGWLFVALILAIVAGVTAVVDRSWPLALLALTVVFLALGPAGAIHVG
jgi:hypothetical protein